MTLTPPLLLPTTSESISQLVDRLVLEVIAEQAAQQHNKELLAAVDRALGRDAANKYISKDRKNAELILMNLRIQLGWRDK